MRHIFHLGWFQLSWWQYLLEKNTGWRNILCRAKGHAGPVWYNSGGYEPDMSCKNCGENLG